MQDPEIKITDLSHNVAADTAISLYRDMLYSRMVEEKMLMLLRQGKVSKWFSGIGQEAISVGVVNAMDDKEFIFPLHRNLGIFLGRDIPLSRLIAQWQGKQHGFTRGRDRSFHFGSLEHHLVGMISHLGPQLAVADGVALAHTLDHEGRIVVAFTGDGGTSEGDFHEALNIAAVWQLPVIFIIENNGYALSTPTDEQYRVKDLADHGNGYGMKSFVLDGNNVLEVYAFVRHWAQRLRKEPEPILVECKTFRMRGHEEASGTKYVPDALFEEWRERDPVILLENRLLSEGIITTEKIKEWKEHNSDHIQKSVEEAFAASDPVSSVEDELKDVFAPDSLEAESPDVPTGDRTLRFVDAISEGLDQSMEHDPSLVLMGQDIATYGGVFKVTEGLLDKYGSGRVRNTPLCESGILGAAMGLSLAGHAAMVEMQFADFVTCGFNQIVNNLAKLHYRWGQHVNVTVRMPCGGNVGAGPFHSQNPEAWFLHVPGLKIVYPACAFDAKGLLIASLKDPNPVLFFEHKYLYRSVSDPVPEHYYTLPLGKARLAMEGNDVTILTYGLGVNWALDVVAQLQVSADIVDLRTLCPLDLECIETSIKKTSKVLILHEANLTGGFGAELAAIIAQDFFEYLDAPVIRCTGIDTPVPFARSLEELYLPEKRLKKELDKLLNF